MAYHERCSLCEVGYRVRGRPLGLEAAHIIPVREHGTSADVRNGLLLCANHHVLFDEFAWAPDEDLRVHVADDEQFRESAVANCVLDWEGKRLPNLPEKVDLQPVEGGDSVLGTNYSKSKTGRRSASSLRSAWSSLSYSVRTGSGGLLPSIPSKTSLRSA